jgi:hypothetical protein
LLRAGLFCKEKIMGIKIKLKNPLDKAKELAEEAKKKLQAAAQKAKDILNAGKEKAALAMFAPFSSLAKIFLRRRGITPAGNLKDLALQVHNERTKKSFGLVQSGDAFDYGPALEGEYGEADLVLASYGAVPITPEMVIAAITFLKGIFDTIKAKKEKGEQLSADEQAIADQAAAIQTEMAQASQAATEITQSAETKAAEVADKGLKDADDANGNFFEKNWKVILAVVILIALIIWFKTR